MHHLLPLALFSALFLFAFAESRAIAQTTASAPVTPRRIVFLGDSITDGHTYPALIAQALADAGKPVPIVTNAGSSGDTARGMTTRLETDVLRFKPDIMTLSVGINDVLRNIDAQEYAIDVEKIITAVTKAGVEVVILTTSTLGEKQNAADARLAGFNAAMIKLAAKHRLRVAHVNELMQKARKEGVKFLEVDDVHPNFEGQRIMARAVLDALGHQDVPVPTKLKLVALPGVISPWKMRAVDDKTQLPVSVATAADIVTEAAAGGDLWKTITLPEPEPIDNVWLEQERQRGFAVATEKKLGTAKLYLGVHTLASDTEKTVCFNTGAQLKSLWVNGKNIYRHTEWHGWHAGRERILVPLRKGDNAIVIEAGNQFFLSVTPDDKW